MKALWIPRKLSKTIVRRDFLAIAALKKESQNAYLLRVNCAFLTIFALLRQNFHTVQRSLLINLNITTDNSITMFNAVFLFHRYVKWFVPQGGQAGYDRRLVPEK
ncbi:MAG: hypothetical protein ACI9ZT_001811 [Gammaproteobacteria bacterium]|jgi:hypothetical protein